MNVHVCEWFAASVFSSASKWHQHVKQKTKKTKQDSFSFKKAQNQNFISGCSVKGSKIYWYFVFEERDQEKAGGWHRPCAVMHLGDVTPRLINRTLPTAHIILKCLNAQIIKAWFFLLLFFYPANNETHAHARASSARHQSRGLSLFVDGCLNLQLTSQVCSFILKRLKHRTLRSCPLLS